MNRISAGRIALAVLLNGFFALFASRQAHAVVPYASGDVFVGVGTGRVKHFSPTGILLETLNTTTGSSDDTGMCFDSTRNLYTTNWTANSMSKFNDQGDLLVANFGSGFNTHPESCVFDGAGNLYVGQADGNRDILKFDQAGNLLAAFNPATTDRGTDWIDLAADQCTLFYTSEGSTIKRFDVCTNTQLPDFATGLPRPCFALRIRSNGEVIVACSTQAVRLNPNGSVSSTYPIAGEFLFALNLDPDNVHFWTAGISSANIYKVNIDTGAGTGAPLFNAAVLGANAAGLAIAGEPTVAVEGPPGSVTCSDGIDNDRDGLVDNDDPDCQACGNGNLDLGEQCDDGNTADGDGCSAICELENEAPDCSAAAPSVSVIWPPNHQGVPVSVLGVTDPDGDEVSIAIDSIRQDEPVLEAGTGSGKTCPDGAGVDTDTAEVRAERAGNPKVPGDGRVYHIAFTADDGLGGTCTDKVTVCVPHNQRPGSTCVDQGPLFDSTVCP